jgi:hypothetical protein
MFCPNRDLPGALFCKTSTATVRLSRVSRALYTSPMPPAPMDARISVGAEAGSDREAHCLNPACQFTRTVIGASSTSSGRELIRKRRPSVDTSYGEETEIRLKPKTRV